MRGLVGGLDRAKITNKFAAPGKLDQLNRQVTFTVKDSPIGFE